MKLIDLRNPRVESFVQTVLALPNQGRLLHRGFTLIEVLVAILILALGMLGIAGLQATTSRYKINSWAHNAAAVLVSDLADRMRANPSQTGLPFGQTSPTPPPSAYVLDTVTWEDQQAALTRDSIKDCLVNNCTSQEIAANDMLVWRQAVRQAMPSGSAWITGDRATGVEVTLMWLDKTFVGSGADAANLQTSPICEDLTTAAAEIARFQCCPEDAEINAGVRCLRFTFIP